MQFNETACGHVSQCSWKGFCSPKAPAVAVPCRMSYNKTSCLAEAGGCFWMNVSETVCGQDPTPYAVCTPCNDVTFGALRGALSHQTIGSSCSWPAVAPFTHGAQVTLTEFASATGGACKAIDDSTKANDGTTIANFLSMMGMIANTASGTCGSMAAIPSPPTMPSFMNWMTPAMAPSAAAVTAKAPSMAKAAAPTANSMAKAPAPTANSMAKAPAPTANSMAKAPAPTAKVAAPTGKAVGKGAKGKNAKGKKGKAQMSMNATAPMNATAQMSMAGGK